MNESQKKYNDYIHILKELEDGEDIKLNQVKSFIYKPNISIVIPVYNTDEDWLRLAIESVINQVYDNWELCIADGGSTKKHVKEILDEYAKKDSRIKIKFSSENKGIAGNSNEALSLATGEFIGFLDHDDELGSDALFEVVKLLNENRDIDFIYTDEDKISVRGERFDPHFKTDWSPDTFRSGNYISHFSVIRKKFIDEVGGFREGYEGSQDYDLFLRVIEKTQRIAHIPKVLYHWRAHESSAAGSPTAKMYAYESGKKALEEHIERIGLIGEVYSHKHFFGNYHIKYKINGSPMVSIIIPTKDKIGVLKRCIDSILSKSSYENYKILLVDNQSIEDKTFSYYDTIKDNSRIDILYYDKSFNYSAINNYAVSHADTDYIIFLNNDTEIITPDWIQTMLEFAQRRDVGAVGALLYLPDNTIQHAGLILGLGGIAGRPYYNLHGTTPGYMGRAKIIQNLSAVTAACLMTKKEIFDKVGGFDEGYRHAFNDVDLCLKIRKEGYLIVYTPYAELYRHESLSSDDDTLEKQVRFVKEILLFEKKWNDILGKGDPYYNPNLSLRREDFSVKDIGEVVGKNIMQNPNIDAIVRDRVSDLDAIIKDKDTHIFNLEEIIREMDTHIKNFRDIINTIIKDKDAIIKNKDMLITAMRETLGWRILEKFRQIRRKLMGK
jgi:glycosyltransferase involved in cell wall biosynthesis